MPNRTAQEMIAEYEGGIKDLGNLTAKMKAELPTATPERKRSLRGSIDNHSEMLRDMEHARDNLKKYAR